MTSDADGRASQQGDLPTVEAAVDPTAIEAASTDADQAAAAARVAAEGRQMDFGSALPDAPAQTSSGFEPNLGLHSLHPTGTAPDLGGLGGLGGATHGGFMDGLKAGLGDAVGEPPVTEQAKAQHDAFAAFSGPGSYMGIDKLDLMPGVDPGDYGQEGETDGAKKGAIEGAAEKAGEEAIDHVAEKVLGVAGGVVVSLGMATAGYAKAASDAANGDWDGVSENLTKASIHLADGASGGVLGWALTGANIGLGLAGDGPSVQDALATALKNPIIGDWAYRKLNPEGMPNPEGDPGGPSGSHASGPLKGVGGPAAPGNVDPVNPDLSQPGVPARPGMADFARPPVHGTAPTDPDWERQEQVSRPTHVDSKFIQEMGTRDPIPPGAIDMTAAGSLGTASSGEASVATGTATPIGGAPDQPTPGTQESTLADPTADAGRSSGSRPEATADPITDQQRVDPGAATDAHPDVADAPTAPTIKAPPTPFRPWSPYSEDVQDMAADAEATANPLDDWVIPYAASKQEGGDGDGDGMGWSLTSNTAADSPGAGTSMVNGPAPTFTVAGAAPATADTSIAPGLASTEVLGTRDHGAEEGIIIVNSRPEAPGTAHLPGSTAEEGIIIVNSRPEAPGTAHLPGSPAEEGIIIVNSRPEAPGTASAAPSTVDVLGAVASEPAPPASTASFESPSLAPATPSATHDVLGAPTVLQPALDAPPMPSAATASAASDVLGAPAAAPEPAAAMPAEPKPAEPAPEPVAETHHAEPSAAEPAPVIEVHAAPAEAAPVLDTHLEAPPDAAAVEDPSADDG